MDGRVVVGGRKCGGLVEEGYVMAQKSKICFCYDIVKYIFEIWRKIREIHATAGVLLSMWMEGT
jgi:hypothetical protein